MNKLIDKDHERIVGLFGRMAAMLKKLESHHEEHRPLLRGERYLTDRDVSQRLRISRRTLQDYRNAGFQGNGMSDTGNEKAEDLLI